MTRRRRRPEFLVVIALVASTTACTAAPLVGQKVSGRVVDIETGEPVAEAYVWAMSGRDEFCPGELGGCHCIVFDAALTRTDANGRYSFDRGFHFGHLPTSKFGTVEVYAPGYVSAPAWIAEHWEESYTSTPAEFVSGTTPAQYFYGTGDSLDEYEDMPLTDESKTYFLKRRPVVGGAPTPDGVTPRVAYLWRIANSLDIGCEIGRANVDEDLVFPVERAIYHEAERFATTEKDFEYLHRICMEAMDMDPILDDEKPCKIPSAPSH